MRATFTFSIVAVLICLVVVDDASACCRRRFRCRPCPCINICDVDSCSCSGVGGCTASNCTSGCYAIKGPLGRCYCGCSDDGKIHFFADSTLQDCIIKNFTYSQLRQCFSLDTYQANLSDTTKFPPDGQVVDYNGNCSDPGSTGVIHFGAVTVYDMMDRLCIPYPNSAHRRPK